jgi:excisionase family DNA binding protein
MKPLCQQVQRSGWEARNVLIDLPVKRQPSEIKSDRTAVLALPDDAILTLNEVAAWLKLHPKTVSQMARERRIPAITLPLGSKRKQFRFVKGAVGKWLSSAVVSSLTLVVPTQKGAK